MTDIEVRDSSKVFIIQHIAVCHTPTASSLETEAVARLANFCCHFPNSLVGIILLIHICYTIAHLPAISLHAVVPPQSTTACTAPNVTVPAASTQTC